MSTMDPGKIGENHVPEQTKGSEMNAVESRKFNSVEDARIFYNAVKARLLNINQWYEYAELPMSSFKLFDHAGRAAERTTIEGDYIRIDIPGPGTQAGEGYDWVIVESILEERLDQDQVISIRVRPAAHPFNRDEDVAHFLKDLATSTFQVKCIGQSVYAEEHGRNEVPNTNTEHTIDNIRNTLVGWGAKIGFSYPQWKSLVKGLLNP